MDLLICQSCGQIIRNRGKACSGCGILMSKHSPTVLGSGIGGATALAVPVRTDPLVLERTVNHIIYGRVDNGNGNGHGNGNGNGHGNGNGYGNGSSERDENVSFLYSESDLRNIVFPGSEDPNYQSEEPLAEPPQTMQAGPEEQYEPSSEAENYESSAALSKTHAEPEPDPAVTTTIAAAAIGTPMAAGAAHALAAMNAAAANTGGPAFQPEASVDQRIQPENSNDFAPGQESSQGAFSEGTQTGTFAAASEPPFFAAEAGSSGADFFAESPENQYQAPALEAEPDSGSDDFPAAPKANFEDQTSTRSTLLPPAADSTQLLGAPPETNQNSFAPVSDQEQPKQISAPVQTSSAQSSSRPGLMDFFSATATAAGGRADSSPAQSGPSTVIADSGGSRQNEGSAPDFLAAQQASIIQNAIKAAAEANTTHIRGEEKSADLETKKESSKKTSKKKSLRPAVKKDSEDEEDSEDKDLKTGGESESSKSNKSKSSKNKSKGKKVTRQVSDEKTQIMGFSVPTQMLKVAGILLLFVGFPVIVMIANVTTIIGGLLGGGNSGGSSGQAITAQAPASNSSGNSSGFAGMFGGGGGQQSSGVMNGQWDLLYKNVNGTVGKGIINLTQSGNTFQGWGIDNSGDFVIGSGKIGANNAVEFAKQYAQKGQPVGKVINFTGQIISVEDNPQPGQPFAVMQGQWTLTKRVGMGWRGQPMTLAGPWKALLTKKGQVGGGTLASGNAPNMASNGGNGNVEAKDPKKAHDFFMKVALGIIAAGVALAMLSLKFFGPSGLLNIWAKKEYIPSQFKAQHYKMVAEMGKPLRPGGLPMGNRCEWGIHEFWRPKKLNIPPDLREQNPHMLLLGGGAKGKSRLMASMIAHDIESADRAVVVVDSDGGLVDLVMNWIAAHPKGKQISKRVIVIDPTHDGEPICYNPLEFPEDGDLQNAASAIVFGFKAIYTEPPGSQSQWNQQTANILRNSAVLLMANGRTLTDLPVLLADNDFRDILLEKVESKKHEKSEYITLIDAWTNYKRLARTDQWINWIEPILNRVQPMLGDPRIRPILTKIKSDLNLQHIIREKKVLFVKIPQGQLDQNGNLLGSLMVTGVKQAALSLSVRGKDKDKKRPCAMYLDEFDTFIEKETFDAITSETRKFQLGFCGASKTLQILPEDYRNQIVINCGIMAVFALAKKDGDMLGPQMFRVDGRKVKHQTIQNVFNKVNTSPQFELISDEEKLNIDRVVGQEERTFFCYRVGTVAGVFNMKCPEFKDVNEKDINLDIIEQMHQNRLGTAEASAANAANAAGDDDDDDEDDEDEEE